MTQRGRHNLQKQYFSTLTTPKRKRWDLRGRSGYWREYSSLYFQEEKSDFSFQICIRPETLLFLLP